MDDNLIASNNININDKNQSSTTATTNRMINCNDSTTTTTTTTTTDPVGVLDGDHRQRHHHNHNHHHHNCHKQLELMKNVPITTISDGTKNTIEDIQLITETTATIAIDNQSIIQKNDDVDDDDDDHDGSIITNQGDGIVVGTLLGTEEPTTNLDSSDGCAHYKRKAKFVTPCCGKFYKCRFCHDENENHHFDRKTLTELICTKCDRRQRVQAVCENCGVLFGKYTCLICNLFDDEEKNQYHCSECGICRVGGRDNFFHCNVCNMCLPLQLQIEGHKCVENISRSNCPVCLGDILTSRLPCHIPRCGHLLHEICFDQLLASGHYVCPTCQTSMIDMKKLWNYLDTQANNIPIPKTYESTDVQIFCNDCHKQSNARFHFVGLKCRFCGGYNTSQNITTRKRSWTNNPSTSA